MKNKSLNFTLYILLVFLTLLSINKFVSLKHSPDTYHHFARDSFKYLKIINYQTDSFSMIEQHYLERAVPLSILGWLSRTIDIDSQKVVYFVTIFTIFLLMIILKKIMDLFNLHIHIQYFFILVTLWNGYAFRYYLAFPYMFLDLLFMLSLTTYIFYELRPHKLNYEIVKMLLLIFALLSKQTTLFIIPVIIFFAWSNRRYIFALSSIALLLLTYFGLHTFASSYSSLGQHQMHAIGLFTYLLSDGMQVLVLLKLILGVIIPSIFPILIFFGSTLLCRDRKTFNSHQEYGLFLIALGMMLQPILAGPEYTQGAATRLGVLALIPWTILSLAAISKLSFRKVPRYKVFLAIILLQVLSLHSVFLRGSILQFKYPTFAIIFISTSILLSYGFLSNFSKVTNSQSLSKLTQKDG